MDESRSTPLPQLFSRCFYLAGQAHSLFRCLTGNALVRRIVLPCHLQTFSFFGDPFGAIRSAEPSVELLAMEEALASGLECLQALRKRPLGRILFRRSQVEEYAQLFKAFCQSAKQWRNGHERVLKARSRPLLGNAPAAGPLSFSDLIHRLVVVTNSPVSSAQLACFTPYLAWFRMDEFTPEPGDYVYWPFSPEPLLSPSELFSLFLSLCVAPESFLIASFGPPSSPRMCRVRNLRDNLILDGAAYVHLHRTGRLPPLASGHVHQIARSSLPDQLHETTPGAFLSQPVHWVDENRLQCSRRGCEDPARLSDAMILQPFESAINESDCVFVLPDGGEDGALGPSFTWKVAASVPSHIRVVVIESGSLPAFSGGEPASLHERIVSFYRLPEGGGANAFFKLLVQAYRPACIFSHSSEIARSLIATAQACVFSSRRGEDSAVPAVAGWMDKVEAPIKASLWMPPSSATRPPRAGELSVVLTSNPNLHVTATIVRRCLFGVLSPGDELVLMDRAGDGRLQGRLGGLVTLSSDPFQVSFSIVNAAGMGHSQARNAGASHSTRGILVFLDEDAVPLNAGFFEFHRKAHGELSPQPLFTAGRVRAPGASSSSGSAALDKPLYHLHLSSMRAIGAWGDLSTACFGVRRALVSDWVREGFVETNPDPRLAIVEFVHRMLPPSGELVTCLESAATCDGEFGTKITMRDQVLLHARTGMAAAILCRQHPHLEPPLRASEIFEALAHPPAEGGELRMDACLSVVEGFKSLGDLLAPDRACSTGSGEDKLLSAILEMTYFHSLTIGASSAGQNSPAATHHLLNQFCAKIPALASPVG